MTRKGMAESGASRNSAVADSTEIIAEWPLRGADRLRVSIDVLGNTPVVNIRKWYTPADGLELRPGRHGIALNIKNIPRLIETLQDALVRAANRGLWEPDCDPPEPPPNHRMLRPIPHDERSDAA
jgi:hypothetical protein